MKSCEIACKRDERRWEKLKKNKERRRKRKREKRDVRRWGK